MSIEQRQRVLAEAMTWLDTPYHHQADVKGAGCDCIFLLIRTYHACGLIPDVDPRPYPMDYMMHRDDERYLQGILQYAHEVETPKPGDVVLFKFGRVRSHGAIVLDWPNVIHAFRPAGKVAMTNIEQHSELKKRIAGFYSLWSD